MCTLGVLQKVSINMKCSVSLGELDSKNFLQGFLPLIQTAILLNSWSITQCFSCWISNIHAHKQTHRRFCCLAILIPGTPTRKGWGWVGAFGVSKTEWSRPHPTPNNSFAPFWQMGKKPLPNATPLLQRQKDHQQTKCFCVSECYCNITTINNAGAKGYWE